MRSFIAGAVLMRGLALAQDAEFFAAVETIMAAAPLRPRHHSERAAHVGDGDGLRHGPAPCAPTGTRGNRTVERACGRRCRGCWRSSRCGARCRAGFPQFRPDACHINRYQAGTKLGMHQDRHEIDLSQPIVSVSLGLECIFLLGGWSARTKRSGFCWSMAMWLCGAGLRACGSMGCCR